MRQQDIRYRTIGPIFINFTFLYHYFDSKFPITNRSFITHNAIDFPMMFYDNNYYYVSLSTD